MGNQHKPTTPHLKGDDNKYSSGLISNKGQHQKGENINSRSHCGMSTNLVQKWLAKPSVMEITVKIDTYEIVLENSSMLVLLESVKKATHIDESECQIDHKLFRETSDAR